MSSSAVHHPAFARLWSMMSRHEPAAILRHRDELLAGLSGRVIEVGAGAGSNFAHYPSELEEVVAVEPEPYLRERARAAAARVDTRIEVLNGVADRLPAEDSWFDAAVACLVNLSARAEPTHSNRPACPEAFARLGEPLPLSNQRRRARPMACDATGNAIGTGLTHIRR